MDRVVRLEGMAPSRTSADAARAFARRHTVPVVLAIGIATLALVAVGVVLTREPPAPAPPQAALEVDAADETAGDPAWLDATSQATGIPRRALQAYVAATLDRADEDPSCEIGWNTLAAIGDIESFHGRYAGSDIDDDGVVRPTILGPQLNGDGFAAITDTDGGELDGDTEWDRAVGPLQFIPETWERWGVDADGDGVANPSQVDDAAHSAARYLCDETGMATHDDWRSAILRYNRSGEYAADVESKARELHEETAPEKTP